MEKEKILSKIQEEELKLLKKIIKICGENEIPYFALGGTLLGAVRHKGFIPWDDDIDLGIPRSYYDRLISLIMDDEEILEKNIINLNVLQFKKKDGILINDKVYDIYIDLFPLDGTPKQKWERNLFLTKFLFFRTLYKLSIVDHLNIVNRGKLGNFIVNFMKKTHLDKILNTDRIINKVHKIAETYSFEESSYVGNILGRYRKKEIVKKNIFGEGVLLPFEDIEINCPVDYDAYLKRIYGNYMQVPSVEERIPHFEEVKNEKNSNSKMGY